MSPPKARLRDSHRTEDSAWSTAAVSYSPWPITHTNGHSTSSGHRPYIPSKDSYRPFAIGRSPEAHIITRTAAASHLTPRPLGLANPLCRVPLVPPLEGAPRCEGPLRFEGPPPREGRAGVMKRDDALEDVGGLSTKDVSVVLGSYQYKAVY
jgi:hypothetical protein